MATGCSPLPSPSPQESLATACHGHVHLRCQPLSRSSSSLLGPRPADAPDGPGSQTELRKSISSTVCRGSLGQGELQGELGPGLPLSTVTAVGQEAEEPTGMADHDPPGDWSPRAWGTSGLRVHGKSSTEQNVTPEGAVRRSHSDLTHAGRTPDTIPAKEASASCSGLGASPGALGCHAGKWCGGLMGRENRNQHLQMTLPPGPNAPTSRVAGGSAPPSATGYSDPGARLSGNSCLHSLMFPQGGGAYGALPNAPCPAPILPIHRLAAAPCPTGAAIKVGDTYPAYCHPLPIPAVQLVPQLGGPGRDGPSPGCWHGPSPLESPPFPQLVSSVSEPGLGIGHLATCCVSAGEWPVSGHGSSRAQVAPWEIPAGPALEGSQPGMGPAARTKDVWTMTSSDDLSTRCRDAGVQTAPLPACKSVGTSPRAEGYALPHVFPEVNLEPGPADPKSPVRDVRWDNEGMTWEVYGASVDPEVLGLAIQKHLEIQIEQFQLEPSEGAPASLKDAPTKEAKRRPFRTVIHSLSRPSCCARSSTTLE
ncbi:G protein-regulated inducer of neurite outgrowth 2 [Tachyglossus aculeatus]|uniref:G protein-regulated inducer of neurite outgrowth 2 n=1 Tax=Tachyglossus aculeatus TaxID=9261 RepID=UPI0018F3E670|nr:G protein-regulated inducer of neurite outgrowth 2 [Tachyglossus aculeatus]XP_038599988.1 G protein-regulated inducer of neurite outgrowth 2 [Tachyglossus aculeatus]